MLRAFALYFQLANIAEQHHRLRRRRAVRATRSGRRASRSTTRSSSSRTSPRTSCAAGSRDVSLELVLTAHPTEATRRTILLAHVRIARLLAPARRPGAHRAPSAPTSRTRSARRSRSSGRPTRCAHERPRVVDEIRHGLWFFEQSLIDAAERLLAEYRRRRARRARRRSRSGAGSAATWTATRRSGPETVLAALDRARALALERYRDEVRALAAALASSRSLVDVSAELDASIARDERELPEYAARDRRAATSASRTAASSRSCGGGSANDGYAAAGRAARRPRRAPRAASRRTAARASPPGGSRRCERRVELFGFHVAKLDVRLHARELAASRDRARRARLRRGRRGAAPARPAARSTRSIVSGTGRRPTCSPCSSSPTSRSSVVPLFETIADLDAAPAIVRDAARRRALRALVASARRPARGDGRLLGLGQGRRLPRRAVGDLPRAGGARRARARGAASS